MAHGTSDLETTRLPGLRPLRADRALPLPAAEAVGAHGLQRDPRPGTRRGGGAEYTAKLADGELSRAWGGRGVWRIPRNSASGTDRQRAAVDARQPEPVRGRTAPGGADPRSGRHPPGTAPTALWSHLGYPYPFEQLVVVDLPVEERDEIYQGGSAGEAVQSELGPVEFAFHSMVDLGRYARWLVRHGVQRSVDRARDARRTATPSSREAFRVLAPGGWFCLDTPNGPVWRLRSDVPMNHDHKIEYAAGELWRASSPCRLRGDRVQGTQPHARRAWRPGRLRRGRGQRVSGRVRRRPRTACCWRWWPGETGLGDGSAVDGLDRAAPPGRRRSGTSGTGDGVVTGMCWGRARPRSVPAGAGSGLRQR